MGLLEGEAKGKLEGIIQTARNLISLGIEIDKISEATGLSIEQIKTL